MREMLAPPAAAALAATIDRAPVDQTPWVPLFRPSCGQPAGAAAKDLEQQRLQIRRRQPLGQDIDEIGDVGHVADAVSDPRHGARGRLRRRG